MKNLFPTPFINAKEENTNNPSQEISSSNSVNYNNNKFFFDLNHETIHPIPVKKQEVNTLFQMNPTNYNSNPESDMIVEKDSFNENAEATPDTKVGFIPIKKASTTPIPNYIPSFFAKYYRSFIKAQRNRFEKIKINVGRNCKQDPIYNHKGNFISTTKYLF